MRYKSNSSENKLLRSGKTFDHIFYFDSSSSKNAKYNPGDFEKELKENNELNKKYNRFKKTICNELELHNKDFVK